MKHVSRRVAALGAAGVFAVTGTVAVSSPSQAAPTTSTTRQAPVCTVNNLRLSVGRVTGGAGSLFHPIRFTNVSGHTCTLRGYPGVSVLNAQRRQIGAPAARNPQSVTTQFLSPGRTVLAVVRTNNPGVVPTCRPTATFVRVFPPAGTRAVLIHYPLRVCGAFDVNPVSPVQ